MNTRESMLVFAISATVLLSFVHYLILERKQSRSNWGKPPGQINIFLWNKLGGFLLFFIIPAILTWILFGLNPVNLGFTMGTSLEYGHWICLASILIIFLNYFNSRQHEVLATYPEIRITVWDNKKILILVGGWLIYLAAYEFLFRGLLLISCYNLLGYWPAIAINLSLYAALHLPKGLKVATAALPFGFMICILTLETGSIMPALFIHFVQAVSCDIFCIWRQPGMHFKTA